MESGEVEANDLNETFFGVIEGGDWEEEFRMRHKVRDPFEHALWLQNEGWQRDASQVHARTEL